MCQKLGILKVSEVGFGFKTYTLGENGVRFIDEHYDEKMVNFNYLIVYENGNRLRVFNPNYVEYKVYDTE